MPFSEDTLARLDADAARLISRYPRPRSALLPVLHLVQSEEGYVSEDGIEYCAAKFGLTEAEVTAVASFYTMYKRRPVGDYHVGVCTNTLCAIMGGDQIFADLKEHLGVGNDETTPDGAINLEHIECNAACDYAPVVMVNWEFFDNMTPQSARQLVDDLRVGNPVAPTRGPGRLRTWREAGRVLAGFTDDLATDGPTAGPASLIGLKIAEERGWSAPEPARTSGEADHLAGAESSAGSGPAGSGVSPADSASPMPGKSPEPGQAPAAGQSPRPRPDVPQGNKEPR